MNGFVKAAVVAALLGASAAASASTFDFSYSFGDGQEVTGDFTGTTTNGGQSVTNISNIQVALNGIAFAPVTVGGVTYGNATLQANTWNPSLPSANGGFGAFDDTTPVTVYAHGALNNFVFSDVDAATNSNPDYEFAYLNDATNNVYQAVAANFLRTDSFSQAESNQTQLATDSPGNAAGWTLSEVTPVPIPGALGLFASGLGLFGFRSLRRRAV
jgi:hypothetical protein